MSTIARPKKTCEITVFLFGKPAWEMDLESCDAGVEMARMIENLGDELKDRLHYSSNLMRKLIENGWTGQGGLYDISFYKEITVEQAKKELQAIGIDSSGIDIHEDEWEDED